MLKTIFNIILVFIFVIGISCKEEQRASEKIKVKPISMVDTLKVLEKVKELPKLKSLEGIKDSTFIRLADYSRDFAYDLRYATDNNFLKEQVYDCAECYTRAVTAKALLKANKDFLDQGVKIMFFDCYRPNSVQHKMWKIKPNPQYVANPYKGSCLLYTSPSPRD